MLNLKELLYIQKSDRRVFLFILTLAFIACLGVYFLGRQNTTTPLPTQAKDSIPTSAHRSAGAPAPQYYDTGEGTMVELFAFDPNTADSTALLRLGLQPWQVRNIYRYRAKGGVYRSKEDFARVYGLTQKKYRELEPYIQISDDYRPAAELVAGKTAAPGAAAYKPYKEYDRDTIRYPLKLKAGETVNLALADTSALKKVPGIGSGWARRIISYGEQLGGYTHVGQLLEIDDFPEETLAYFTVHGANPRKLNLNKLTLNQLRRHPYINFYQARDIVDYRRLKGPLKSLADLRLHKDFPAEAIERLAPYVEF